MSCQVEVVFPIFEVDNPTTRAWFVDGGCNQGYGPGPTSNLFAPGARPHQIGTTRLLRLGEVTEVGNLTDTASIVQQAPRCLAAFNWGSNYLATNGLAPIQPNNQVDQYGNYYVQTNGGMTVFSPSGSVNCSMTGAELGAGINAWWGSNVINLGGFDATQFFIQPILNGQYLLAFMFGGFGSASFAEWYVILEPSPTGTPTVLGAVFYTGLTAPPYGNYLSFVGVCNNQTTADPILLRATAGTPWVLVLIPSVDDIIGRTYASGFGSGYTLPLELPGVFYSPIATTNFSNNLLVQTSGSNRNLFGGFALPDASDGTNLYFYFNRSYMDFCAASPGFGDTEVRNVIQPSYPDGAIVRIAMGNINYHTAATAAIANTLGGTPMYTIDNSHWVNNSSVAQIPFTDEYTYISTGGSGGTDCYSTQPAAIVNRGGGVFWIYYYMPGIDDSTTNLSLGTLYERIRVFEYNSATQIATQIVDTSCVLYTSSDIPGDVFAQQEWNQTFSVTENVGEYTIAIFAYLYSAPFSQVYHTDFCTFVAT